MDDARWLERARRNFLQKTRHDGECVLWTGASNWGGYGVTSLRGTAHTAHRAAWLLFVGPIPDGHEIDHHRRCNRLCVNLDHLRCVPRAVNLANRVWRAPGPACGKGHTFTPENTGVHRQGFRYCKRCARDRAAARRARARV